MKLRCALCYVVLSIVFGSLLGCQLPSLSRLPSERMAPEPRLIAHMARWGGLGPRPPLVVNVAFYDDGTIIRESWDNLECGLTVQHMTAEATQTMAASIASLLLAQMDEQVHAAPDGAFVEIGLRSAGIYKRYRWSEREQNLSFPSGEMSTQQSFVRAWLEASQKLLTDVRRGDIKNYETAWQVARYYDYPPTAK